MEYIGLLLIGILIGFLAFWFKNKNNQSTSETKNRELEAELKDAQINLAAEKAEKEQLKKNNEFMEGQIKIKENTIEKLTKGLDSNAELKKLHNVAMQEMKEERNKNDKIVSKQENFLEKLTGNYQFQGYFNEDILKNTNSKI